MKQIGKGELGKLVSLFYSIILFLVVYNPPIYAGISFSILAVLFSILIIISNRKILHKILSNRSIRSLLRLFLFFSIYFFIVALLNFFITANDNTIQSINDFLVSYVSFFLVTFAIVIWAIKKNISFDQLCKLYLEAGIIQIILVFLCLTSPSIKTIFNEMTVSNTNSEKISMGYEFESAYRNFGFASTLYDIFGFAMAVLGIMSMAQALKGKKYYYIVSLAFAIAASINARSAFIIYIAGFMVMILAPKDGKIRAGMIMRATLLLSIVFVGVYFLFSWILKDTSSEQLLWLASAITETQSLSGGQSEGFYDALFNRFIFFPDGLSLIFGTGMPPHLAINKNSDMGYIQNIWQFGIVGSIMIYAFYIRLFKNAIKKLEWPDKTMLKTILIMMAIYLVKLTCFGYSQASVIFGPICILATYYGSNNRSIALKKGVEDE